jgi:hypothetical protein
VVFRLENRWLMTPLASTTKMIGSATPYYELDFGNCGLAIPNAEMMFAFAFDSGG